MKKIFSILLLTGLLFFSGCSGTYEFGSNDYDYEDRIQVDADVQAVIKDLKGLKVLATERNGMKYYNEAINKINVKEYEELMTVRDGDQNVRFVVKERNDVIEELLLLVGAPEQFVMISFVGKINLDQISKLSKSADISGLEHLEKVGN